MKKFLSLVLALVMTMSLVTIGAGAAEYKDLTDKSEIQYDEAVAVLNKLGIITGYEDGSFKPTGALTRGAAAKIIVSLMIGSEAASNLTVAAAPYSDVPVTNTFAGVISYCKTAGYINGYADGTFRPTAPLTGYAFAKMLLGALGYDGKIEGFTGAGWTMNVARLGNAAGLFDDFATAFKGNDGINREEACLLALNTLKATEVEYTGGASVSAGDASVVINAQRSYKTSRNDNINQNISAGDSNNTSNYYTLEFGEEHFPDLKLDNIRSNNITDDFGRPANQWSYKNVKIGTYALKPDYVYTADASGDTKSDKVKSMGLKDFKWDGEYSENGVTTQFVDASNNRIEDDAALEELADMTEKGLRIEVYMSKRSADTIAAVVVIHTQLMQVSAVRSNEVTFDFDNTDHVDDADNNGQNPLYKERVSAVKSNDDLWNDVKGLKADDYVLVVPLSTDSGRTYTADSVTVPQTVTGTLTNVKLNASDKVKGVTVAGTAYSMSELWNSEDNELKATTTLSSSVDTTIYLDAYGYVIYAKDVQANNSAIIVDEIYSSLVNGKLINYAKGWDSKGNAIELNLGTVDTFPGNLNKTTVQGQVFEYATTTKNNAEYQLIAPETTWNANDTNLVYTNAISNTNAITNGQYTIDIVSGKALPFDADVKFIFISTDLDNSGNVTDVTGITVKSGVSEVNLPATGDFDLTFILNSDRNKVVAVVIPNDDDAGNTANLLYLQKLTGTTTIDGRRVSTAKVWINGESQDVTLDDPYTAGDKDKFYTYSYNESTKVYTLSEYTKAFADGKQTVVASGVTLGSAELVDVQNNWFYYTAEGIYLNAKNAQVEDLYSDDGHTYKTVKDLKDAIKNQDKNAKTGNAVQDFVVSFIYNADSDSTGYKTVSKLFITKTN